MSTEQELTLRYKYFGEFSKINYNFKKLINIFSKENLIISYPKCGRTWLQYILSQCIKKKTGINDNFYFFYKHPQHILSIPFLKFSHLGSQNFVKKKNIHYIEKKNIVFLIRKIEEVLISYFYHLKFRDKSIITSLDEFINNDQNIHKIIDYYNYIYEHKNRTNKFCIVTYDDLIKDSFLQINKIQNFFSLKLNQEHINYGLKNSTREKMRDIGKYPDTHPSLIIVDRTINSNKVRSDNHNLQKLNDAANKKIMKLIYDNLNKDLYNLIYN